MTSIVIPYREGPDDGLELRYALRSLKNLDFPHQVFIMGSRPKWIRNVQHVPTKPVTPRDYMCFLDTHRKMYAASVNPDITERFVVMYDDTYFIAPTTLEDIATPRANTEITEDVDWSTYGRAGGASRKWVNLLRKVIEQMRTEGKPTYNWETHLPRLVEKHKVYALVHRYSMINDPWNFFSLYMNTYAGKPELIGRQGAGYKLGVYEPKTIQQLRALKESNQVLNHGTMAYNKAMKLFLDELFPEKSIYEA